MTKVIKELIEPTDLSNTDEYQNPGDASFNTKDLIFLDSYYDEVLERDESREARRISPTDWALANGAYQDRDRVTSSGKKGTCWTWLRSALSDYKTNVIDRYGDRNDCYVETKGVAVSPALRLNLATFLSARNSLATSFKKNVTKDGKIKVTMELGFYPKNYAGEKINKELEKIKVETLNKINKKYLGRIESNGDASYFSVYEYKGKKYVRAKIKSYSDENCFFDGSKVKGGDFAWFKIEPIVWEIRNWEDLPRSINPNGNGTAKFVDLKTEEGIMTLPFYINDRDKNVSSMWQNSIIRAQLNGYDLHEEIRKGNGNKNYMAPNNYNFKGKGFIEEAFSMVLIKEVEDENLFQPERQVLRSRLERLNPDTTPAIKRRKMTHSEIIKSWIDNGESVMLVGPSGIGKTERLKTLYPNHIYLKLTEGMFPEKVVGTMNLQTGEEIPPNYAKQALMEYATEEEKKQIKENVQKIYDFADEIYERSKAEEEKILIILDELLNVSGMVQSLVYSLVLERLVEIGGGMKLPANTVIAATGNQIKYSTQVAKEMAEPLGKRFFHVYDIEPRVGEWIYEYAIPNKLHPMVISYIFNKYQESGKSEEIEQMGYFYEEPEVGEEHLDKHGCKGKTNDPRCWSMISKMLYNFEEDLKSGRYIGKDVEDALKRALRSRLREEWAEEFYDFYNNPILTPEDIVKGRYTEQDLPRDMNEKMAYIGGLLGATEEQVGACREFIRKNCSVEDLAVYDIYWARENQERMELIAELDEMEKVKKKDREKEI